MRKKIFQIVIVCISLLIIASPVDAQLKKLGNPNPVKADSLLNSAGTTTYWNNTGSHSALGASYMGALDVLSLNSRGAVNGTSGTFTSAVTAGGSSTITHKFTSANADGFIVYRTTSSPYAAAGRIVFNAQNSNSNEVTYARINGLIQNNASNIHSGAVSFRTTRAGVDGERVRIDSSGNIQMVSNGVATTFIDSTRNLLNINTITSTELSSFGTNGGMATIPAGGVAKVYISGLTTSGAVTLGIKKNGFVTVSDTLQSWIIPNNDTLYIRYKYNETVGYAILKK